MTKRLQKIPATAGKVFRFQVPVETFADPEDGNTRQLRLELIPTDGRELSEISWIGYNASAQVIFQIGNVLDRAELKAI